MFNYNDGGRSEYFKGETNDCAARAMAIALGLDYKVCYQELAEQNKKTTGKKTVRDGIFKNDFSKVLKRHGWEWVAAPLFSGRKAKCSDLPNEVVIARQSKHFVAVIDGIPQDTFDSSLKMVYGYWRRIRL